MRQQRRRSTDANRIQASQQVKLKERSPDEQANSLLLEESESLPKMEAYQMEQRVLANLLNQTVKDLINCPPSDHAQMNILQGMARAYEIAGGMNKLINQRLRAAIRGNAVQAPVQK
jgi:hypothetical protein